MVLYTSDVILFEWVDRGKPGILVSRVEKVVLENQFYTLTMYRIS